MRLTVCLLIFLSSVKFFAQEKPEYPAPMIAVDSLYREDQFYAGFSYNLLMDRPADVTQKKFSAGFYGGILRDMPINKARTRAIATGIGVTYNKYFQNIVISKVDEKPQYTLVAAGQPYAKNKFDQIFVDVPLEYRWRNSTPESHKFWRVYSGIKFSYLISGKSVYVDETYNIKVSDNSDFNNVQVGAYVSFGYNTWNFYTYYGLTPLFKSSATLNGRSFGMNALNLGLMFYIL